jgi:hypothetical protein
VVRPEPDVSIIVGFLFLIPADRVAAVLCGSLLKEIRGNRRPAVSMRAEAAPCPWYGITNTSKPASRIGLS